jgi:glycerol uptake facilitator-like aquaporin
VQDRGLAAYIAELVGTLILTFAICTVVVLFVATSAEAQTGSDFAVVGLVHGIALFGLIITLGAVSGGHFNPAVTLAAAISRRIDWVDAAVYMLAQLSGAVLGALLVKGLLLDEGRAANYGATQVSPLLANDFAGAVVEGLGVFFLVLAVCAVAFNPRARKEWAPLAIGLTLRPAHRVGREPGTLVRPRLDRQRVGRRLAVPGRPDRRRHRGSASVQVRDRRVAVRARSGASNQQRGGGRKRRSRRLDRGAPATQVAPHREPE